MTRRFSTLLAVLGGPSLLLLLTASLSLANSDSVPSGVIHFDFAPRSVDTTHAAQAITFTMRVTVDLEIERGGAAPPQAVFASPSGQQVAYVLFDAPGERDAGAVVPDVYQGRLVLPQYSESGVWQLRHLLLADAARTQLTGNDLDRLGFPTTFRVSSATSDVDPPHVIDFALAPRTVRLPSPAIVLTLHLTDDLSGVTDGMIGGIGRVPTQARFTSPSGHQMVDILLTPSDLISGTAQNGIYEGRFTLPLDSEVGRWQLQHLLLVDDVGNQRWLKKADLDHLGFPLAFDVRPQPFQPDPSATDGARTHP